MTTGSHVWVSSGISSVYVCPYTDDTLEVLAGDTARGAAAENAPPSLPSCGGSFWSWNCEGRRAARTGAMRSVPEAPGSHTPGTNGENYCVHSRWGQSGSTSCPLHIHMFYFFNTPRAKPKHNKTLAEPRCWPPIWYRPMHWVSDRCWAILADFQVCTYSSLRSIVWGARG